MTQPKNMAYWRAKNNCKSAGSFDGNLKNKRSPMRQDSEQEKKDERLGKGIFNKPADEKKKEESSPTKQMTKFSDIKVPKEPEYNMSGDLYKKPSIVASDERKKSVREQVGDYNTAIDEFNEKKKQVRRYKKAKNTIKDALRVSPSKTPGYKFSVPEYEMEPYIFKRQYIDHLGRITTPHSPKKKK